MNKNIQEEIISKYSQYFKHYFDQSTRQSIRYGFECNDGWADLIKVLLLDIHNYISINKLQPIQILQLKEKLGGLRIYVDTTDPIIIDLINKAEALSVKLCEYCGTSDNLGMTSGWMHSICKNCFDKNEWRPDIKFINKSISEYFNNLSNFIKE